MFGRQVVYMVMSWIRTLTLALVLLACACGGGGGGGGGLPGPRTPLSATPDQEFRHTPPEPGPPPALRLPTIHVDRLSNGLTLILLRRPGARVASVRFVTRRGGEDGPNDQAGLAWMTGEVLASHTSGESPLGEDHLLEQHGLRPDVQVEREYAALSVWMTTDRLPQALELMAQTLREPTFLPSQIEQARAAGLRQLEFYWSNPERSALSHARRANFGPEARITLPIWGTRETLSRLTREQVMAHYSQTWTPNQSALVVAGDLGREQFLEMAERLLGSWTPPEAPPAPTPRAPIQAPWTTARILGRQTRADQSMVLLVDRAPARSSEDYVAFSLLTRVLGQMFSSPLNLILREQHGYSYGVHASYQARRAEGDLMFMTLISQERLIPALRAVISELHRLRTEGPTPDQLETARALMREELLESLESCSSATGVLAELFADGSDPSEIEGLELRLRGVEVDQVRAVAQRWLRPDEAPLVVTGRPEVLFGVQGAGIGDFIQIR
jgi:zinc protease